MECEQDRHAHILFEGPPDNGRSMEGAKRRNEENESLRPHSSPSGWEDWKKGVWAHPAACMYLVILDWR